MQSLSFDSLATVAGGFDKADLPAGALRVIANEATRDHSHSTASGPFALIAATRKHYMGADWQSTDLDKQFKAANRYVTDRYKNWDKAAEFWDAHGWY